MIIKLTLLISFLATTVYCQGLENLKSVNPNFLQVDRNISLTFPDDHGSHPYHQLEWWYFTANLKTSSNEHLGIQWTLFRTAIEPPETLVANWKSKEFWMGNIAVTTADSHLFAEKVARGGVGQAGVSSSPFAAWIDNWQVHGDSWKNLQLVGKNEHFSFDLNLTSDDPLIYHGENGFSLKSLGGTASAYYSQPFFSTSGTVTIENKEYTVTGQAWADREWSSQLIIHQH